MQKLLSQNFKKSNIHITLEENGLNYFVDLKKDSKLGLANAGVYLIVAENQQDKEQNLILYVGKAGKGLNKRFNEHKAGYERKVKSDKKWISSLQERMEEIGVKAVSVWYRESKVLDLSQIFDGTLTSGANFYSSQYSLEEEALINYLKIDQKLINTSFPPEVNNINHHVASLTSPKSSNIKNPKGLQDELSSFFEDLYKQIESSSKRETFEEGKKQIYLWSEEVKSNFYAVIGKLSRNKHTNKLVNQRIAALRKYSAGPFRGSVAIVYGEFVGKRFSKITNDLHFSLDGKYLAIFPFNSKKVIFLTVEDYLGI
jgi:hypothetical protein